MLVGSHRHRRLCFPVQPNWNRKNYKNCSLPLLQPHQPSDPLYIQLSRTVLHCCMSNGNFRRSIEQYSVAWILVEMMTVPSGEIDVKMSFSCVPRIPDSLQVDFVSSAVEWNSKFFTFRWQRRCAAPTAPSWDRPRQRSASSASPPPWTPTEGRHSAAAAALASWTANRVPRGSEGSKCKLARTHRPVGHFPYRLALQRKLVVNLSFVPLNRKPKQALDLRSGRWMRSKRHGWTRRLNNCVWVKESAFSNDGQPSLDLLNGKQPSWIYLLHNNYWGVGEVNYSRDKTECAAQCGD